jgi:hypothetical protein
MVKHADGGAHFCARFDTNTQPWTLVSRSSSPASHPYGSFISVFVSVTTDTQISVPPVLSSSSACVDLDKHREPGPYFYLSLSPGDSIVDLMQVCD